MSLWILESLLQGTKSLQNLLRSQEGLPDRIVCFLSVLELARLNHIDFEQEAHLTEISIQPKYSHTIPEIEIYELNHQEDSA